MGFLRYEQALRKRPLRTKSMTSGLLTVAGSLVSEGFRTGQVGQQPLATFSHAVYGFCIGGTIPHLFYKLLEVRFSLEYIFLTSLPVECAREHSAAPDS